MREPPIAIVFASPAPPSRRRATLRGIATALATALLVVTGPARAEAPDVVDACASASEKGQELRDQAKLVAARELFVACAAETCPAVVRKDCTTWLAEVDEALPSIAIHARDAGGRDLTEVRVTVDGAELLARLDGRARTLDPGPHEIVFEAHDLPSVTQRILLREREKGRLVDVVLGAKEPPKPADRGFSIPTGAWILGGASLLGFGALAGFGVSAQTAADAMRSSCAPGCSPGRVDEARRDLILANVGLGVGVLALGAATILVILDNRSPAAPPRAALRLEGTGLSLTGAF